MSSTATQHPVLLMLALPTSRPVHFPLPARDEVTKIARNRARRLGQ